VHLVRASAKAIEQIGRTVGGEDREWRQAAPRSAASTRVGPIFAGLMVAMVLASLDQTIVSTALPTIVGPLC
jgi:hypothetical protein